MFRKRFSLVLRIAVPFALLLVVTTGGLYLYLSSFIKESYLEIIRDNLESETELVADRIAVTMQEDPSLASTKERALMFARLLDLRVTIIDKQGAVLSDSYTPSDQMENHFDRPEVQQALQKTPSSEVRYSDTLQTEMLYAAAPIYKGSDVVGVARLAVSLRTVQRNLAALLNTVLIATAAAALLAVALSVLIAAYTVAPIRRISEAAQSLASEDEDEILSTWRQDEIGQLHHSIQSMAQRQKEQIASLHMERSKLEAVLANMADGVIIVDPEGMVQLYNPAAVHLFKAHESQVLNHSLVEFVRHHQLVEIWRLSQSTGEQQTVTMETSPDRLFIQGIATPLASSLPGMTLMVFQNLTRVRRLETVRRDFVSNVSHELRTPLASLKALTETLQEGALEDPPAARRFLHRMETEIDNLTQMVQELLELSRIESNKVPIRRVSVRPCDLFLPAVERMQTQAERAGLSLRADCAEDLPLVSADPDRIGNVLVNLLHNAIKFTQPGGEIVVSAKKERYHITFSVHDTGVGIPPEVLPRIFERFYKADRARSGGGTGLGLSISRHIVEAHGGRIWAESEIDQGSTFSFTLPLA